MENSYMLPQGARCTDSARATHPARLDEEGEHGQGDGDPAVQVALLGAAGRAGPVRDVPGAGRGAGDDLRPLQYGGAAALLRHLDRRPPAAAAARLPVSAAAVRPTLLRLPKTHSAMWAKKARV